jgi:hypothetical protein
VDRAHFRGTGRGARGMGHGLRFPPKTPPPFPKIRAPAWLVVGRHPGGVPETGPGVFSLLIRVPLVPPTKNQARFVAGLFCHPRATGHTGYLSQITPGFLTAALLEPLGFGFGLQRAAVATARPGCARE